jgi:hypothetical protein
VGTSEDGYIHCGPSGSGHFVKMVHNGIEYGIMQAYAEGFDIFKNATSKDLPEDIRYDLNLPDIAEVWRRGSVISSWLLDLTAMALIENPTLAEYSGFVQDSGEGRWTIQAALEEAVPAEVLTAPYTRVSARARITPSPRRCSPPCARSSAATSNSNRRPRSKQRARELRRKQWDCLNSRNDSKRFTRRRWLKHEFGQQQPNRGWGAREIPV